MKNIFVNCLILFVPFAIASCTGKRPQEAADVRVRDAMISERGASALGNRIVLTEIREGRISNAIEALEFSIDCSVVVLGQRTNYNARNQELILTTLRMLKEYRQKYPREIQVPSTTDESKQRVISSRKAEEILDAIK